MAGYILYSSPDEEKKEEVKVLEEQIKEEENDLLEEYRKLGEAYFEQNKLLLNVPSEFCELFDAIKEHKAAIEQYKKKTMLLKKTKICPYCNSEIPQESVFCIMCGKKVQEIQPQKMENTVTCKYCGTVLPAGSKFCGYCAHSLVDEEEAVTTNELLEDTETPANAANEEAAENKSYESDGLERTRTSQNTYSQLDRSQNLSELDDDKDTTEYDDTTDTYDSNDKYDTTDTYDTYDNTDTYDSNDNDDKYNDNDDNDNNDYDDQESEEEDDLYATTAANTGWNAIKICPRCHKKLDRSSKFCTGCGARLSD